VGSDTAPIGSFDAERVACPAGAVAVGGGIDPYNVLTMSVTSSGPIWDDGGSGQRLLNTPDGANPAPAAWQASIRNDSSPTGTLKVAAICDTTSSATTVVGSATASMGSFDSVRVPCPAGTTALAGGIDLFNVLTMSVTASAPVFDDGGSGQRLIQTADGTQPAPIGWQGSARNESSATGTLKVAAICAPVPTPTPTPTPTATPTPALITPTATPTPALITPTPTPTPALITPTPTPTPPLVTPTPTPTPPATAPIQGEIKTKIQLKFNKFSKDKISVQIKNWSLPPGLVPTDVTVDVGGAAFTGTLDAKGKFKSLDGRDAIKMKQSKKTQLWKINVKRKNNDFAADLADDGLTDADNPTPGLLVTVPLTIEVGGALYGEDVSLLYKSKLGKKGTAK
jgi:hypothetical protein